MSKFCLDWITAHFTKLLPLNMASVLHLIKLLPLQLLETRPMKYCPCVAFY